MNKRPEGVQPIFCRIGSKAKYAKSLISLFPEHSIYVEPFVGSGAVFFRKEPSEKEVINDLDKELIQDYKRILKAPVYGPSVYPLMTSLEGTKTFMKKKHSKLADKLVFSIIRRCNGFGSKTIDPEKADYQVYSGRSHETKLKKIDFFKERLRHASILNQSYEQVFKKYDSSKTFFFMDPPYEMSEGISYAKGSETFDFEKYASECGKLRGKFLITLNDSPKIRKLFSRFNVYAYLVKGHAGLTKGTKSGNTIGTKDRKEVLISNYPLNRNWKKRMVSKKVEGGAAPVKKPDAKKEEPKKEEEFGPQLSAEDKVTILGAIEWLTKQGVWNQLPSATQKFIEKYGNWKIHTSMVTRKPVNKLTEYVTNLLSEGKLKEFKATAGYDEYYHLGSILFLMDPKTNQIKSLQYEKLDRPTLREVPANQEFESKILVAHRPITLAEAVKKHVEHMGASKYYTYNAFSENCQNFLIGFYKALGESTPTLDSFILQPLDELLKTLPEYSKSLANIITNLGATTNNWLEYFGFKPLVGGVISWFEAQAKYNKDNDIKSGTVHKKGTPEHAAIAVIAKETEGKPREKKIEEGKPEMSFFEASKIVRDSYAAKGVKTGVMSKDSKYYPEVVALMYGKKTEEVVEPETEPEPKKKTKSVKSEETISSEAVELPLMVSKKPDDSRVTREPEEKDDSRVTREPEEKDKKPISKKYYYYHDNRWRNDETNKYEHKTHRMKIVNLIDEPLMYSKEDLEDMTNDEVMNLYKNGDFYTSGDAYRTIKYRNQVYEYYKRTSSNRELEKYNRERLASSKEAMDRLGITGIINIESIGKKVWVENDLDVSDWSEPISSYTEFELVEVTHIKKPLTDFEEDDLTTEIEEAYNEHLTFVNGLGGNLIIFADYETDDKDVMRRVIQKIGVMNNDRTKIVFGVPMNTYINSLTYKTYEFNEILEKQYKEHMELARANRKEEQIQKAEANKLKEGIEKYMKVYSFFNTNREETSIMEEEIKRALDKRNMSSSSSLFFGIDFMERSSIWRPPPTNRNDFERWAYDKIERRLETHIKFNSLRDREKDDVNIGGQNIYLLNLYAASLKRPTFNELVKKLLKK